MPVTSRDAQFGAAIGFILIVGIVAIYFGFSAKLVLALLAGLGILFCASLVEGYVRAAMLGTGVVLLLLVAYDLATSCDSACQQTRAEAAQQRAAQQQASLAANQARLAALRPPSDPACNWDARQITLGPEWVEVNPRPFNCKMDLFYSEQNVRLWVKTTNDDTAHGPFGRGQQFPNDVEWIRSEGKIFTASVRLSPAPQ